MLDRRLERVALAFEEACHASGHDLCGRSLACLDGLRVIGEDRARGQLEMTFDASKDALMRRGEMPGHHWPTSTLIRMVHDALLAPPHERGLQRATLITTGLARLAERGIPADCLVRTCVGPALIRRIIVTVSSIWSAIRNGTLGREQFAHLEAWLQELDACPEIESLSEPDVALVCVRAMKSRMKERTQEWLGSASITHIIGWRIDDFMRVAPQAEDVTLPCGAAGTRWVYERFTKTYIGEWDRESIDWEAAYVSHPTEVAKAVGIDQVVLDERVVTTETISQARLRTILGASRQLRVDGMSVAEVFETVLAFLEDCNLQAARDLARHAFLQCPSDETLRLMYAFCLIPVAPREARGLLENLPAGMQGKPAVWIDRAAIALKENGWEVADSLVRQCPVVDTSEPLWLWAPDSLMGLQPRVVYCTAEAWIDSFMSLSDHERSLSAG